MSEKYKYDQEVKEQKKMHKNIPMNKKMKTHL